MSFIAEARYAYGIISTECKRNYELQFRVISSKAQLIAISAYQSIDREL